jgi:Family of unknown function (DUF6188)
MIRSPEPVDLSFLTGATVTRAYFDQHAAGLLFDLGPPAGTYDWRVEQRFRLRSSDQISELDPEDMSSMVPLLSTLGRSIEAAMVEPDGRIRFKLSGAIEIDCGSDSQYEAWQLNGPRGFLVVCVPGGGLSRPPG